MVQREYLALPFCREVYGQDIHRTTTGGKEFMRGDIVELMTVVTLDNFDGAVTLDNFDGVAKLR
jgi:hypothetical protein